MISCLPVSPELVRQCDRKGPAGPTGKPFKPIRIPSSMDLEETISSLSPFEELDAFYAFHTGSRSELTEFSKGKGIEDPLARAHIYTLGVYALCSAVAVLSPPETGVALGLGLIASWLNCYLPRVLSKDEYRSAGLIGLARGIFRRAGPVS